MLISRGMPAHEFVWKNTQYHHSKNKQNVGLNKLSVCDSLFLFQYVFKHVFIIVIYLYNIIKLFSETKRLLMNIWTHLFGKTKGFFECWSLAFVRLCYVVIRCNFIDYISFIVQSVNACCYKWIESFYKKN